MIEKMARRAGGWMALCLALLTLSCQEERTASPTALEEATATATTRLRAARRIPAQAATLQGQVLDAVSGAPIGGLTVRAQGRSAKTAADGTYLLTGLESGSATVRFERYGYTTLVQTILLAPGANSLNPRLAPGRVIRVLDIHNQTHLFDFDSADFAATYPFSGFDRLSPVDICTTSGVIRNLTKDDFTLVKGPGLVVKNTPCCPGTDAEATAIGVTLKTGETFTAYLRNCVHYGFSFIGTDPTTGRFKDVGFSSIVRIEFP